MTSAADSFIPGADTAEDLERRARAILPADLCDWLTDASGDMVSLAANRAGFGRYRLLPRVMATDPNKIDLSVDILGTKFDAPIFCCPTGGVGMLHKDGEKGIARAAKENGLGFILNGGSGTSLEDVAAAAGPARWQQISWQGSRLVMTDIAKRVKAAGYKAVVFTADNPLGATRRRTNRSGFRTAPGVGILGTYASPEWKEKLSAERKSGAATEAGDVLSWKNVEWFRSVVEVPFIVKGLMTAEDAVRAISIGADGILVSNHGGRALDGSPGTIEVLEEIVQAVDGRIPVLIDGGFRSANDVVIALALGASAVGIGRPLLWALGCGGAEVLSSYLEDLVDQLRRTFGMVGAPSVAQLTRKFVSRRDEFLPTSAITRFLPPWA